MHQQMLDIVKDVKEQLDAQELSLQGIQQTIALQSDPVSSQILKILDNFISSVKMLSEENDESLIITQNLAKEQNYCCNYIIETFKESDMEMRENYERIKNQFAVETCKLKQQLEQEAKSREKLEDANQPKQSTQDDTDILQARIESLQATIDLQDEKISNLQQTDTDNIVSPAEMQLATAKIELGKANHDLEASKIANQKLKQTIAQYESDIKTLHHKLDSADETTQKLQQTAETTQKSLKDQNNGLQTKLKDISENLRVTTAQKAELEKKLAYVSQMHEKAARDVTDEFDELNEKVQTLEELNADLRAAKTEAADQISELKSENQQLADKLIESQNQMKDIQQKLHESESDQRQLQEKLKLAAEQNRLLAEHEVSQQVSIEELVKSKSVDQVNEVNVVELCDNESQTVVEVKAEEIQTENEEVPLQTVVMMLTTTDREQQTELQQMQQQMSKDVDVIKIQNETLVLQNESAKQTFEIFKCESADQISKLKDEIENQQKTIRELDAALIMLTEAKESAPVIQKQQEQLDADKQARRREQLIKLKQLKMQKASEQQLELNIFETNAYAIESSPEVKFINSAITELRQYLGKK